jgi:hypothetical protein
MTGEPTRGHRSRPAAAERARGIAGRISRAWRALTPDQRLAAIAAIALLLSMLLPWYQETGNAQVGRRLETIHNSKNAFQVYSFVEAAVFVVSAGVLALLFARGERRSFHLPGGDGTVIMAAGVWVMVLIFYRQFDRPDGRSEGLINTTIGVDWGIFVAFLLGLVLAYAGYRIRAAHIPEPADDDAPPPEADTAPAPAPTDRRREPPPSDGEARTTRVSRPPLGDDELDVDEPTEYRPPPRR